MRGFIIKTSPSIATVTLSLSLSPSPSVSLSPLSTTFSLLFIAQLILQPFLRFTYVTTYSPTFPSFHLRQSSFSNPSVALPTSQCILQYFRCFTYVTAHSPTLLSLLLRHRLFAWLAAHAVFIVRDNAETFISVGLSCKDVDF